MFKPMLTMSTEGFVNLGAYKSQRLISSCSGTGYITSLDNAALIMIELWIEQDKAKKDDQPLLRKGVCSHNAEQQHYPQSPCKEGGNSI